MPMLHHLRVVGLFRAMLLLFWLAFLALGGMAWWGLNATAGDLREVHEVRMARQAMLGQLIENVNGNRAEMLLMFQHDPAGPLVSAHDHELGVHLERYIQRRQASDLLRKQLKEGIVEPQELGQLQAIDQAWAAWRVENNRALDAARAKQFGAEVMGAYLKAGLNQGEALNQAIAQLRDTQQQRAETAAAAAKNLHRWMTWACVGMMLGIGLPFTFAAWLVLRHLKEGFEQAERMARAVAEGDLSQAIDGSARNEIGQLSAHLEAMRQRLRTVIGQVRHSADGIETAAGEVAAGNADLSQRTEQTAANLQRTASSAEQLGTTVQQNAQHAAEANQLAEQASQVVGRGGEAVAQVVETMKGIHDSSSRIADIIGVIDGIAFQTNILALNAAVEAARAGEQGRGFAVVAAEVRSLAQRSASAAREIKGLIQDSVDRVGRGTTQAGEAGATMQEVVHAIRRVTDIVAEISHASAEQSAGVQQVGEAVHRMDEATQQNAALVEQSAAAAQSLRGQAQGLVQVAAVFQL